MTSAGDQYKQYTSLYHDFTEAYTHAHSLTREFYPQAKKFVEHIEPELTNYIEKISHGKSEQGGSYSYQKLLHYMNRFDDFTLMANKLFIDLKMGLEKSDNFMTRVIDIKLSKSHINNNPSDQLFIALMPELNELIADLKHFPERANNLETKMKKLESDWQKTKEKIT